jgi:hypothetical protein
MKRLSENLDKLEITDGEDSDVLVCRLITEPLYMNDNLVGLCSDCHRMIQFRPHAPKTPKKVCDDCAIKGMDKDARFVITEQSLNDLQAFIKKQGEH